MSRNTKQRRARRPTSESAPKTKRAPLRPIEYIHQASFEALVPFVNIFDPGIQDWNGEVIHSIPKEFWSLNRRAKRGEANLTYNDLPWNRSYIGRNVFKVEHVRDHIERRGKHYFTGGKNGTTLFMLDHDEHEAWQKGLARPAWDILAGYWLTYFGCEPYHRDSGGGYHAYPILAYPLNCLDKEKSYQAVNTAYQRLQYVVGLLLLARGNYSTFEVKGTITTRGAFQARDGTPLRDIIQGSGPQKEYHPWQKPLAEFEHLIKTFTNRSDLVVDPFGGSFTTALACKRHGRRVISCDIDPTCVATGRDRLSDAETRAPAA